MILQKEILAEKKRQCFGGNVNFSTHARHFLDAHPSPPLLFSFPQWFFSSERFVFETIIFRANVKRGFKERFFLV